MIGALIRLPILVVMATLLVWGGSLILEKDPQEIRRGVEENLRVALTSEELGSETLGRGEVWAKAVGRMLPELSQSKSLVLHGELLRAAVHAIVTLRMLPVLLVMFSTGVVAGVIWRERIRYDGGYASPTAGYVARYLLVAGILYSIVFAVTPIVAPYWTLYLGCGASALGGLIYVGNLPLRV